MRTPVTIAQNQLKDPGVLLTLGGKRFELVMLKDLRHIVPVTDNDSTSKHMLQHKEILLEIAHTFWKDYGDLLGLPGQAINKAPIAVIQSAWEALATKAPEMQVTLVIC